MYVKEWLGEDNQLGIDIWEKKYRRYNESFESWVHRVSGGDPEVEQLIKEKKFLFGGRILANRGVSSCVEKTSYSNCYVIKPPEDSIEDIYDACKQLARTYSYGGGCGLDISNLSPKGAKVRNQAKTSSGAVSFMDTFSQVTETICQNGRRGALILTIDVSHPDVIDFIKSKEDLSKINYANISVKVSDNFMHAVLHDKDWNMNFTRESTGEVITKVEKARDILKLIATQSWNTAEPGLLYWDTIEKGSMLRCNPNWKGYGGVNPCGELPLPVGGSCLLGALNLAEFCGIDENNERYFDFDQFEEAIRIAVGALNEVLDEGMSHHPLDYQVESVRDWRQIGLGIMGLADLLIKLHIPYNSKEAIELCDAIGHALATNAIDSSCLLAEYDQEHYPKYHQGIFNSEFYLHHALNDHTRETWGLANSQLLTIAPTGTISTMLGVSGGMEPLYARSYTRTTQSLFGEDVKYKIYPKVIKDLMEELNIYDEDQLPDYTVTALEIDPMDRINMQATWQRHIDGAIASTINLPNSATIDDVYNIYIKAWSSGLKGVTVYRDGCAREGILTTKDEPKQEPKIIQHVAIQDDILLPDKEKCLGLERHLTTGCGSLHVCAYFDEEGNLHNTYLSKGSTGGCHNYMVSLSRMMSLAARKHATIEEIVDQLHSCGTCPSYAVRRAVDKDTSKGSCCPAAVGHALLDMQKEYLETFIIKNDIQGVEKVVESQEGNLSELVHCPECGAKLIKRGCYDCPNCGWSKCQI